jgi:aspartyl-tRNA(Asn)/glutamyl-tRNA(Gln) amidotransferase subunit B
MDVSFIPVIGLEIHVELKTSSKMFCQCSGDYFGKAPNSNVCPVCLGMPGALPVPNRKAIEWTIKIAKALHCTINTVTKFDRKHYFYPDLPKGYQISQYDEPIGVNGYLEIGSTIESGKKFRIHRVHLEEDTGKLMHQNERSLVDFNRSGVPLVEIVTEADFSDAQDVKLFLQQLQAVIRYADVSDADMEKGSMRLEPNISLRIVKKGQKYDPNVMPPYKVEVKNINSFNYVKKAIEYETIRQKAILEKGEIPPQETRGYDERKAATVSQRSKEEAQDYRYFPEPDIPPLVFEQSFIDSIRVPELPGDKNRRFVKDYQVSEQVALALTKDVSMTQNFESIVDFCRKNNHELSPKDIANLIVNRKIEATPSAEEFVKKALELRAPKVVDAGALNVTIEKVLAANAKAVEQYKSGKDSAIMFLVGQVMREMKGAADAQTAKKALEEAMH